MFFSCPPYRHIGAILTRATSLWNFDRDQWRRRLAAAVSLLLGHRGTLGHTRQISKINGQQTHPILLNSRFLSSVVLDGQFTHMELGDYWWAEKRREWMVVVEWPYFLHSLLLLCAQSHTDQTLLLGESRSRSVLKQDWKSLQPSFQNCIMLYC